MECNDRNTPSTGSKASRHKFETSRAFNIVGYDAMCISRGFQLLVFPRNSEVLYLP